MYHQVHRDRSQALSANWRATKKDKTIHNEQCKKHYYKSVEYRLYQNARQRARRRGMEFTIDHMDVIVPAICPVFGTPFKWGGGKKNNHNSPSLDRIDSSKGYIKGNVAVISNLANKLKNTATKDQLLQIVSYINYHDKLKSAANAVS